MNGHNDSALAPERSVILRWEPVLVDQVTTRDRDLEVSPAHVEALKSSFALLGGQLQLQPILLDSELVLIDGAHRLEAAKQSNWSHIAAVIVTGASQIDRPLIEAEANRVRRSLSVLELEEVWRTHYEPGLRAAAKLRQLDGLRRRSRVANGSSPARCLDATQDRYAVRRSPQESASESLEPVIRISNNGDVGRLGPTEAVAEVETVGSTESPGKAESLTRAAKRITGFSLDTLDKVSQIRALATATGVPIELKRAAESGLARLRKPGASVESIYRALCNLQLRLGGVDVSSQDAQKLVNETSLERLLSDASLLAERLRGSFSVQVLGAACSSQSNREMLRAARVALTHSLAETLSLESTLDAEPARALQRLGAEVTRLLSKTSRSRLEYFARSQLERCAHSQQGVAPNEQLTGQFADRAAA